MIGAAGEAVANGAHTPKAVLVVGGIVSMCSAALMLVLAFLAFREQRSSLR
jgi:hypothetical protein